MFEVKNSLYLIFCNLELYVKLLTNFCKKLVIVHCLLHAMNMDASLELVNYYENQYNKSCVKRWSIIQTNKKMVMYGEV